MSETYFHWLVSLLGDEYIETIYSKLLTDLFYKEFIWSVEYDENRAKDGLEFRHIFMQEYGNYPNNEHFWPVSGCSVLEMMIGMAKRCEDELIYNPEKGDRTSIIFWVMIENLGLDIYDDYAYYHEEVDRILDDFLYRRYDPNSTGNLFILRRRDPRNINLWLQLNLYLGEHFREYWDTE